MLTRSRRKNAEKESGVATGGEAPNQSPPEPAKSEESIPTKSEENKPTKSEGVKPMTRIVRARSGNITSGRAKHSEKAWAANLEALKQFKAEHGHTNVPKCGGKYKQLGRFVNNQRQFYRKKMEGETNSLTDDRVKDLEELGFLWAMKPISENRARGLKAQWERRLQELQEYKDQHGHCNPPVHGKDGELGKFVMNQRYHYKTRLERKNSLTPERIQELEQIGIVWTLKGRRDGDKFLTNEEKWERNVKELKKFKEKFGHVNVVKSKEFMELGQFVGNQRYFYRRRLRGETTSLTDDRIKILSGLGFEWKNPNKGGDEDSKVYITSKMKGNSHVVERDEEITLPDKSTIYYTTKESSQKKIVVLEDGSNFLETSTEIYTTKVEKIVVLPGVEGDVAMNLNVSPPDFASGLNVLDAENEVIYPDGSSVSCTTEERSKKRLFELEDGTHLLDITTTITRTRVERAHLPKESQEVFEM